MLNTEQNQLIDKYFSKEGLSSLEQTEFDQLCETNTEFLKEFEFKKSLQTTIFRQHARQSAQKRIKQAKVSKVLKTLGISIAAISVVLASAVFYVVNYMMVYKLSEIEAIENLDQDFCWLVKPH